MKIIAIALLLIAAMGCARAADTVVVTQEPSDSAAGEIERSAVALLTSCDYEAGGDLATDARWRSALGHSNVHIVFAEPRKVTFAFSTTGPTKLQELAVEEILVPVSAQRAPDYILATIDGRVRAFAKYHDRDTLAALQNRLTRR